MAAPTLLGSNEFADYGVDPNKSSEQGQAGWYDPTNNRYQTSKAGTYLYHGDVGGNNVGWYASADPYNASAPAGGAAPGAASAPPDPLQNQGNASQTYSSTPGAAPTQNTTNQGTQDVVRNSYLKQVLQPKTIDTNDPAFRQQADTYAAAQERARRTAGSQAAEQLAGTGATGAQDTQQRMINERAAQNSASFEADLVGKELTSRRSEIQNALSSLSGMISGDQARALQKELADIDAQLKQAGLDQSGALGSRELDIKSQLGMGGLNVDLMRLLTQNQQFNNNLGFQIGDREATLNQHALDTLLGGG